MNGRMVKDIQMKAWDEAVKPENKEKGLTTGDFYKAIKKSYKQLKSTSKYPVKFVPSKRQSRLEKKQKNF